MARKRRSREEARAEILAAATGVLAQSGPDAIRLDDVAAAVGVSRQAVLHHFGSREALLREVVRGAWVGLFGDLQTLVGDGGAFSPGAFVDQVDDVTRRRGNARLGAWLLLSGEGLDEEVFTGALGALPKALSQGAGIPEKDAQYALLLVGAALFGDAIFGARLRQALDLPDGEVERADFRRWLVAALWRSNEPAD